MEDRIKEAQNKFIDDATKFAVYHKYDGTRYVEFEEQSFIKYIGTLLTEARKKLRKEWLEEEILKLKKCLSGQKIDYGHDCYDHACRYCENAVIDSTLEDQISRLEAELKAL